MKRFPDIGRINNTSGLARLAHTLHRYLLLALFALCCVWNSLPSLSHAAVGGTVLWQIRDSKTGIQMPTVPTGSAVDTSGNIYITGYQNLAGGTSGEDFYTVKITAAGVVDTSWGPKTHNEANKDDRATAIAIDSDNNVIVVGNVTTDENNKRLHIVKYSGTSGAILWQSTYEANTPAHASDSANSLAVHGDYVYVTGVARLSGSTNDDILILKFDNRFSDEGLNPHPPVATVVYDHSGTQDAAVSISATANGVAVTGCTIVGAEFNMLTLKYDLALTETSRKFWTHSSPLPLGYPAGNNNSLGRFVKVDPDGNVIATGFDTSSGKDTDIYTAKYDGNSSETVLWYMAYRGNYADDVTGLTIDANKNVYITGKASRVASDTDFYTAKYKGSDGTLEWDALTNGNSVVDVPTAIVVDDSGEVYVTGYSKLGGIDAIQTMKYLKNTNTTSGRLIWQQTFKNPDNPAGSPDMLDIHSTGIVLSDGGVVVVGWASKLSTPNIAGGSATAGSTTTLQDSSKTWGSYVNYYLKITAAGANNGQVRLIMSNTANTLTVSPGFPVAVSNGDSYEIYSLDTDYYALKYEKGTLDRPTDLTGTTTSNSGVHLTWADNSSTETGFKLERCKGKGCDFTSLDATITLGENVTSYDDSGLDPDAYYYYRVKAYTETPDESSDYSNSVRTVTVFLSYPMPLAANIFTYNGPGNQEDTSPAVAVGPDNNPVVTGRSNIWDDDRYTFDYYTIKLDRTKLSLSEGKLWSAKYDGGQADNDEATCLAVDKDNNVIVSGDSVLPPVDGGGNMNVLMTLKYLNPPIIDSNSALPTHSWSNKYNGPGKIDDRATAVATDGTGNFVVVGHGIKDDVNNHQNIYVVKYNGADNTRAWAGELYDAGESGKPAAVVFGADGNIFVTGQQNAGTAQAPDFNFFTNKYCGNSDPAKCNNKTPGQIIWTHVYDSTRGNDYADAMAIDSSNNIYVTGSTVNSAGKKDFYTIKYDGAVNTVTPDRIIWSGRGLSTDGSESGEAMAVRIDPVNGDVLVAGTVLTDPGNHDFALIRYNANGDLIKKKVLYRPDNDDYVIGMALDNSGNAFVAGNTSNGSGTASMTIQFDSDGNVIQSKIYNASTAKEDVTTSIAVNSIGEAFIAGTTRNSSIDYLLYKLPVYDVQVPAPIAASTTYSTATFLWPANSTAEGTAYKGKRADNKKCTDADLSFGAEFGVPANVTNGINSYTSTGLTKNTDYCFQFKTTTTASGDSRWIPVTVTTADPAAPTVYTTNYGTSTTPAAFNSTTATIIWNPNTTGHSSFEIERCMDASPTVACSDFAHFYTATASEASYVDTTVCPGNIYRYRVKAIGSGWESAWSLTAGAIPPTSSNLVADSGFEAQNPMEVGWRLNFGGIEDHVSFDSSETHNGSTKSLKLAATDTRAGTQIGRRQVVNVAPGGKYLLSAWFKSGLNATGSVLCELTELNSAWGGATPAPIQVVGPTAGWTNVSATITIPASPAVPSPRLICRTGGTTPTGVAYIDDVTLTPVIDVSVSTYSESQLNLSWKDNYIDESGYKVYRCKDAGCTIPDDPTDAEPFRIVTLDPNTTSYTNTGLEPNAWYRYRITALKAAPGSCNNGWHVTSAITAPTQALYTAPVLSKSLPNTTQVNLAWTDTTTAESAFILQRCTGSGCTFDTGGNLLENTISGTFGKDNPRTWNDTGVCSSTEYQYRIKAINNGVFTTSGCWKKSAPLPINNFKRDFLTRVTIPGNNATPTAYPGMKDDFSDIRIYDETAKKELPYWIEAKSDRNWATVWFKTASNNTISLYYDNANATNTGTLANVFGSGVMGFWPFSEPHITNQNNNGNKTYDLSGLANNLNFSLRDTEGGVVNPTLYGASTPFFGNAYGGNGGGYKYAYFYSTPSVPTGTIASVEAWVYPKSYPDTNWNSVVSWGARGSADGFNLAIQNSGRPSLTIYGGYDILPTSGPTAMLNAWNHIAGVVNGTSVTLYMNGQAIPGTLGTTPNMKATGDLFVGVPWNSTFSFNGLIDDVRIYSRALSSTDIASRYAAAMPVVSVGAPSVSSACLTFSGWGDDTFFSAPPLQVQMPVPAPPINLNVIANTEAKITLTWINKTSDQTGFKIFRCMDTTGTCSFDTNPTYTTTDSTAKDATVTYIDTVGLEPSKTYRYMVKAYKSGVTCPWDSATDTSPTKNYATTPLNKPSGLGKAFSVSADCNEVRFSDSDGSTILSHWLEYGCSTTALFWLKFSLLPTGNKTIYLHYNNSTASAPAIPSLGTFFDFYDDFAGTTINTSKWGEVDGTGTANYINQNNGLFVSGGNTYWNSTGMYSISNFNRPFILEVSHKRTGGSEMMFGAKNTNTGIYYPYLIYGIYPVYDGNGNRLIVYQDGTASADNLKAISSDIWQYYKIEVPASGANYYHGSVPVPSAYNSSGYTRFYTTTNSSATPLKIGMDVKNQAFTLGSVKIRKYATPEPSVTLLPGQNGSFLTGGAWKIRQQININNSTGSALADYQLPLFVDTSTMSWDQIRINWTNNTTSETGHIIERCIGDAGSCTSGSFTVDKTINITGLGTTSYVDRDIKLNTPYCYRVSATRTVAPVWTTTPTDPICEPRHIQTAPVLGEPQNSASQITLTWSDPITGENGYVVERCAITGTDTDCTINPATDKLVTLGANVTTYTDVQCSGKYKYRVKAVKYGKDGVELSTADGWPGYSNEKKGGIVSPPAPTLVKAVRATEMQINISWVDNTADEMGFKIYRCKDDGETACTNFALLTTRPAATGTGASPAPAGTGTTSSYSDTRELAVGGSYRYRVTSYGTGSCNWESDAGTVDPVHGSADANAVASVSAPSNNVGITANTTGVNISWTDNTASESSFALERCDDTGCVNQNLLKSKVFYTFNGNINDSSGNNLNLTQGAGTLVYEDGGLALNTGTWFQSATTDILNKDMHAIEFDIKIRATNISWTKIFGYSPSGTDRSPGLWLHDGNSPTLHWRYDPNNSGVNALGVTGDGGTPFTIGQWYHIRGVKTGSSFIIYVNGTPVVNTTVSNPKTAGNAALWFGGADVTIKNFSVEGSGYSQFADTTACAGTTYTYRIKAIENGFASALVTISDFQANSPTRVIIPASFVAGRSAALINDLRFYDSTAKADIPYWIQKVNADGTAVVWIKSANNTITLYANRNATGAINASSVSGVFGTGLVGYWPFEEAAGTTTGSAIADTSGKGNSGTLIGGASVVESGKSGNGLNLNGTSSYLEIPVSTGSSLDINGSTTIELWYYYNATLADADNSCKPLINRGYDTLPGTNRKFNLYLGCTNTITSSGSATADSPDKTTLTNASGGWTNNSVVTSKLTMNSGDNIGQSAYITGNTATVLTFYPPFTNAVKNTDTYTISPYITNTNRTVNFSVSDSSYLQFRADYGGPIPPLANNAWNHIVARYDADPAQPKISVVINGVESNRNTTPPSGFGSLGASAQPIRIGVVSGLNSFHKGTIDEVRIYNRPLSDPEIASRYAATPPNVTIGAGQVFPTTLTNPGGGNWSVSAPVSIVNFQPNYQTRMTIAKAGKMKEDFSDIRFYDTTSQTELTYYIERKTTNKAVIWFKTGTYNTVAMYYGNPSALPTDTPASSFFEFFDDFDGSLLDEAKWTASSTITPITCSGTLSANCNYLVSGGKLTLKDTAVRLTSTATFGAGKAIEAKINADTFTTGTSGFISLGLYGSSSINGGILHKNPMETTANTGAFDCHHTNGNGLADGPAIFPIGFSINDSFIDTVGIRDANTWDYKTYDDTINADIFSLNGISATGIGTTPIPIAIGSRYNSPGSISYSANWDWVRVRKYVYPEPSASVDTMQFPTLTNPGVGGSWTAGTRLSISNFQPDYQIRVPISTAQAAGMKPDLSDLRFYDNTAQKELPYWIESIPSMGSFPSFSGGGTWTSRESLLITNFQPNFLTRFDIPATSVAAMKPDLSDLRFYDYTAPGAELDYWIERISGGATVWIKTGANNTIAMYYGNPGAGVKSNKNLVFGTGLVGYWPFNESVGITSGTINDFSGSGNGLTMSGFTAPNGIVAEGKFGYALSLDGSGDYAYKDAPTGLPTGNPAEGASIEAWIYPKAYSADPTYTGVVSFGPRTGSNSLILSIQNSGRPSAATWGNDFVPTTGLTFALNTWNHIAVVSKGTTATLYLNGQPYTGNWSSGNTPNFQSTKLAIGVTEYPGRYFNGLIDEVRIYNRALTQSDINARYNQTLPTVTIGSPPSVVWVRTGANNTISMYYGNNLASSSSNAAATFDFFDGFDNNLDTSKWSATGSASVSNGRLQVNSGAVYSKAPLVSSPQNRIFEIKGSWQSVANGAYGGLALADKSGTQSMNADNNALTYFIDTDNASATLYPYGADGNPLDPNIKYNLIAPGSTISTNNVLYAPVVDGQTIRKPASGYWAMPDGSKITDIYYKHSTGYRSDFTIYNSSGQVIYGPKSESSAEGWLSITPTTGIYTVSTSWSGYGGSNLFGDVSQVKPYLTGIKPTNDVLASVEFNKTDKIEYAIKLSDYTEMKRYSVNGTWNKAPYLWLGYFKGSNSTTETIDTMSIDWVRARKFAYPEPVVTVDAVSVNQAPAPDMYQFLNNWNSGYSPAFKVIMPQIGNLVSNVDFENGMSNWSVGSGASEDATTSTSGLKSLKISKALTASTSELASLPLPQLLPGGSYTLSGSIKASLTNGTAFCRLAVNNATWDNPGVGFPEYAIYSSPVMIFNKVNNAIPDSSNTSSSDGRLPLGISTGGMGLATSPYGIPTDKGDTGSVQGTAIIRENASNYRMWYSGNDHGVSGSWRIYAATSTNGIDWSKGDTTLPPIQDTGVVPTSNSGRLGLGTDVAGIGDRMHVYVSPAVIKDAEEADANKRYKMWYSGHDRSNWRIYYATSPDGLNWTKYDNSVPAASDCASGSNGCTGGRIALGTGTNGDKNGTFAPTVVKDLNAVAAERYKMWYSGNDGTYWRIFYATSADGLTWIKKKNISSAARDLTTPTDGSGQIPLGSAGKGDDFYAMYPHVVWEGGTTFKMWYTGYNVLDYPVPSPRIYRILHAISTDGGLNWTKQNNSVIAASDTVSNSSQLTSGTALRGDAIGALAPFVLKEATNVYTMWYSGFASGNAASIYRATTTNNGSSWTKQDNTVPARSGSSGTLGRIPLGVTPLTGDTYHAVLASIIKDAEETDANKRYKMWYSGSEGAAWRIYHATSADGLVWNKLDQTMPTLLDTTGSSSNGRLPVGSIGKSDSGGVFIPSVVKDTDAIPAERFKMWYTASDNFTWRGILRATSPDGLAWTKTNNTIFTTTHDTGTDAAPGAPGDGRLYIGSSTKGDSRQLRLGPGSVIWDGGQNYKMWYSGNNGNWRIYYAYSKDGGKTWIKKNNDVPTASDLTGTDGRIPLGTGSSGDNTHTAFPTVYREDANNYKMWYTGTDGSGIWRVYYATSTDGGLTWTKQNNTLPAEPSDTSSSYGRLALGSAGKGDFSHIQSAFVLKDNDKFRMWYQGFDQTVQQRQRIYHAIQGDNLVSQNNDNLWHSFSLPITLKSTLSMADAANLRILCGISRYAGTDGLTDTANFDMLQLVPNTLVNLTATNVSESQNNLSWTDNMADESGFKIWRCKDPGCTDFGSAPLATVSANVTSFTDMLNLKPNTAYSYKVNAYKTAPGSCNDGWDSNPSNVASVTTANPAPTLLTAKTINTTQVNLAWTDSSKGESGFAIERSNNGTDFFPLPPTVLPNATLVQPDTKAYSDTTACPSTEYTYRLKAIKTGLSLDGGNNCAGANPGWNKRVHLAFVGFQPQYQTLLNITNVAGMKPDFSDLRFYDSTANKELPYWIESKTDGVGGTAKIWLKTGDNNNIDLYYGNPSAASVSSTANTFDFYEDFSGTAIDTGKWSIVNYLGASLAVADSGFSVSGGNLHATNTTGALKSLATFPAGSVMETKVKTTAWPDNETYIAGFDNSPKKIGWLTYSNKFVMSPARLISYYNKSAYVCTSYQGHCLTYSQTDYTTMSALMSSNNLLYRVTVQSPWKFGLKIVDLDAPAKTHLTTDGIYWGGDTDLGFSDTRSIILGGAIDTPGGTYAMDYDWVRVRKYTATEPTVVLGSEISPSSGSCFNLSNQWGNDTTTYYSNTAKATTASLEPPSNVLASEVNPTQVKVTWVDRTGDESGFEIQDCCTNCSPASCLNMSVPANTTTYSAATNIWSKRAPVTITNSLANFPTMVTITISDLTGVKADLADIRFYDYDSTASTMTELPYWIERISGGTATVWIKTGASVAANHTIYLYYGNNYVSSVSDGTKVFDFFDDFNGAALDAAKWSATSSSGYSVNNDGTITITQGAVYSKSTVVQGTQNRVFEMKSRWLNATGSYSGINIANAQSTAGSNTGSNAVSYLVSNPNATGNDFFAYASDGVTTGYNIIGQALGYTPPAAYIIAGFEFNASNPLSYFAKDLNYNELKRTNGTGTWNRAPYIWMGFFSGAAAGTQAVDNMQVDWLRVRPYTTTPPVGMVTIASADMALNHCYSVRAVKADAFCGWPTAWSTSNCVNLSDTIHLDAVAQGPFSVKLDWTNKPEDGRGFEIEKKLVFGGFSNIATVGNVLTYTDKVGVDPLKSYIYRVRKTGNTPQTLFSEDFSNGLNSSVWFMESGHGWRNDTFTTPTSYAPYTIDYYDATHGHAKLTTNNGALELSSTATGTGTASNYELLILNDLNPVKGDFDLQFDYSLPDGQNNSSKNNVYIRARIDIPTSSGNNQFKIDRATDAGQNYYVIYTPTPPGNVKIPTSDTSGKMRATRVGNTISYYVWNNSDWLYLGGYTNANLLSVTGVSFVQYLDQTDTGRSIRVLIDNIKILTPSPVNINPYSNEAQVVTTSDGTPTGAWISNTTPAYVTGDGNCTCSVINGTMVCTPGRVP